MEISMIEINSQLGGRTDHQSINHPPVKSKSFILPPGKKLLSHLLDCISIPMRWYISELKLLNKSKLSNFFKFYLMIGSVVNYSF